MRRETTLMVLYLCGLVTSLVCTVCMAVVWLYWRRALDTCSETDCGCVLGGTWSFSSFFGGSGHLCRFLTIGPLPIIFWSALMASYHGYGVCKAKKNTTPVRNTDTHISLRRRDKPPKSPLTYILFTAIDVIISILALSCCIIMTDGFHRTCGQYKKSVITQLNASGNLAELVLNRLSCSSVYDFMDYLQPDPSWLEYKYRRGSWLIYSGSTLLLALITIWVNFITFALLTVYNCILYFKERKKKVVQRPQSIALKEGKTTKRMLQK